jgi:hypothetical protein
MHLIHLYIMFSQVNLVMSRTLVIFCAAIAASLINESEGKPSNAITDDKYVQRLIEKRPWTNPVNLQLEKRFPFRFMKVTLRDLQLNCDGQCFYHKGVPGSPSCSPIEKDCGIAVSIAQHSSPKNQCEYISKQTLSFSI